ncbi:MAG: PPC domain-containing DNA-binding protein [Haloplanus sp.]
MDARELTASAEYLATLETGADWRAEIEEFAAAEGIDSAWFTGLGSVSDAELWYYDQHDREYRSVSFDEPLEVASCVGNVATRSGDPFAHSHAVLSRPSGQALAGHLDSATVFAGEVYLRAFEESFERTRDDETGLDSLS